MNDVSFAFENNKSASIPTEAKVGIASAVTMIAASVVGMIIMKVRKKEKQKEE